MNFRFKQAELGTFSTKDSDVVVRGLAHGCRIMGLTRGEFSLIDLIHSILKKTGSAHIVCCTWSAGIKDVHQVKWMVDTELVRSFRLVTDHSYKTRQKKYALAIEELFGLENIRTSEIHAKFCLIHNEDWKVCIRTSMNLNANRTCESFELDEDPEVFGFYMRFIEHTFGAMPAGFTSENWRVNVALGQYFTNESQNLKRWSEL